MPTDRAVPNLPSRDLGATESFYAGLGFARTYADPGWLILDRGSVRLEFFVFEDLDPTTSSFRCTVRVADVDELVDSIGPMGLPRTGIPRLEPVAMQAWGLRAAHLVDPDGSLLVLIEDQG